MTLKDISDMMFCYTTFLNALFNLCKIDSAKIKIIDR